MLMSAEMVKVEDSADCAEGLRKGEVTVLAALAEIEAQLREGERLWSEVVGQVENARRDLVLATTELQKSRRVAENRKRAASAGPDSAQEAPPPEDHVDEDEARRVRLLREFESVLTNCEKRRVALHSEMEQLRCRRQDGLALLSVALRSAHASVERAGKLPAIAVLVAGHCAVCAAAVPRSAASVCSSCGRLLYEAEGPVTGSNGRSGAEASVATLA